MFVSCPLCVNDSSSPDELLVLSYEMFAEMRLIDEFQIIPDVLKNFLLTVRSNYHDNPFHNWSVQTAAGRCEESRLRAVGTGCVLLLFCFLLVFFFGCLLRLLSRCMFFCSRCHCNCSCLVLLLRRSCRYHGFSVLHFSYLSLRLLTNSSEFLTQHDVLALMVASLCHDVDHPGNTNSFEINTGSELGTNGMRSSRSRVARDRPSLAGGGSSPALASARDRPALQRNEQCRTELASLCARVISAHHRPLTSSAPLPLCPMQLSFTTTSACSRITTRQFLSQCSLALSISI